MIYDVSKHSFFLHFSDKAAREKEQRRRSTVSGKKKKKVSVISSESVKIQPALQWYDLLVFSSKV